MNIGLKEAKSILKSEHDILVGSSNNDNEYVLPPALIKLGGQKYIVSALCKITDTDEEDIVNVRIVSIVIISADKNKGVTYSFRLSSNDKNSVFNVLFENYAETRRDHGSYLRYSQEFNYYVEGSYDNNKAIDIITTTIGKGVSSIYTNVFDIVSKEWDKRHED